MSEDLIRRSDAIDAVMNTEPVFAVDSLEPYQKTKDVVEALEVIPSADRPQGEWIVHKERTGVNDGFIDFFPTEYECSNCGLKQSMYFINSKPSNFCPNCGADMREREDEPQTETEVVRTIIHKMIDNTDLAEDAYPGLRQRLHDAVDEYEPKTDCPWK